MTFPMNAWHMAGWSDELGKGLAALMGKAFSEEDKPLIEAAYASLDGSDFWDVQPVFLGIDASGTRARRLIQQLVAQERTAS